jgi:hypothetical protein
MLGDYSSIAEDLEYLTRDWHSEIESADLRRGSSVVRRLLVDGGNARLLLDAWRAYGFNGQPIVRGPDLMEDVKGPLKTVSWASAGGIRVRSSAGAVGAVVVYNVGPSPVPEVKHSISYDPYPEWSLAEYQRGTPRRLECSKRVLPLRNWTEASADGVTYALTEKRVVLKAGCSSRRVSRDALKH